MSIARIISGMETLLNLSVESLKETIERQARIGVDVVPYKKRLEALQAELFDWHWHHIGRKPHTQEEKEQFQKLVERFAALTAELEANFVPRLVSL